MNSVLKTLLFLITGLVILSGVVSAESGDLEKLKESALQGNIEDQLKRNCELSKIPIINFDKSGKDLGAVCGRPHKVSMLAILDPGNSKILEYID